MTAASSFGSGARATAVAIVFLAAALPGLAADPPTIALVGGRVYDGETFERRDLFIEDGMFVETLAGPAETVLDVRGKFLVPPLADAHTHRFHSSSDAPSARDLFLGHGVFYVANLCNPIGAREDTAAFSNHPEGVEVAFANGGITGTGGHPIRLYEDLHAGPFGQPAETFWETNNDSTFFVVDNRDDLNAKWNKVLAGRPDLIKILLLYSERYDELRNDVTAYGSKGLNPALVPVLVERAHAAGLRVAAHVETAADFRHAVRGGVDLIAHTPGYGIREGEPLEAYRLSAEDGALAAERDVVHVTTAAVDRDPSNGVIAHNLRVLRDAGVRIAIGSDRWMDPMTEYRFLLDTGVWTPEDLLRIATLETAPAIFPERRIGRLDPGYEGSVLVLGAPPVQGDELRFDIVTAIKNGVVLPREDPGSGSGRSRRPAAYRSEQ